MSNLFRREAKINLLWPLLILTTGFAAAIVVPTLARRAA
jgi:hypothetical protein